MMGEVLMQALKLTVVGMGMTFGAIGALIGGMYLLTGLTTDRSQGAAMKRLNPTKPSGAETAGREVAAAAVAAVAAAAEEEDARDPKHIAAVAAVTAALASAMPDTAAPGTTPRLPMDVWTLHVRSQQLTHRTHYNALRAHRSNW
jgi:Na+-transporting methylmalonyl-CoA/oxaloacetate decarboxylase gamma subunit